ncbi:MAG: thioredoxin family protein [Planctomycetota bacterium]|nr:thioredoxin family protein [Planctomycetota bacterium]
MTSHPSRSLAGMGLRRALFASVPAGRFARWPANVSRTSAPARSTRWGRSSLVRLASSVLVIVGVLGASPTRAATEPPTQPSGESKQLPAAERPQIYDPASNASKDLEAALARAKADHSRVLIQWGGNWCIWCHRLHDLFKSDPAIRKLLRDEYQVVLIDIGRRDKNMDLAEKYHADLDQGVPFLTVLASDGTLVQHQETGSLERGDGVKAHDPAKVLALLEAHRAPQVAAQDVLDAALARAKQENKGVLLHFGAPWCGWCKRLESWLHADEVQRVLEPALVLVKIDVDRFTGGRQVLDRFAGGISTGLPFSVTLSSGGEVVGASFIDGANIGFPTTDPEITHVGAMIRAAAARIDARELEAILARLRPEPAKGDGPKSVPATKLKPMSPSAPSRDPGVDASKDSGPD